MQTSVTTDTSGAVTSRTRYKAFGEVLLTSNQETTGTLNTERKFTGQIFDTGTDLYFYNARYYDRTLRRFTQADTVVQSMGDPQDLNRYAYARNNPLKYNDPSGNEVECPTCPEGWDPGSYILTWTQPQYEALRLWLAAQGYGPPTTPSSANALGQAMPVDPSTIQKVGQVIVICAIIAYEAARSAPNAVGDVISRAKDKIDSLIVHFAGKGKDDKTRIKSAAELEERVNDAIRKFKDYPSDQDKSKQVSDANKSLGNAIKEYDKAGPAARGVHQDKD